MLHIFSRDNALYKQVRRLAQGWSDRQVSNGTVTALLEGIHLCQDWLQHHGQPTRAIFDAQRLQHTPELQDLAQAISKNLAVTLDSTLMGSVSAIAKGQGVVFVITHDVPALPNHIDQACIWLDRIQDPGNVGTILRTAAAAGITQAYLSPGCANVWSPRVLRSAQGAHFAMTLHEQVNLVQACGRLRIPLCATAVSDTAVSLYEARLPFPCAWVFGNEGQGVDPELLARAEHSIYIPQDSSVESLNVGVAVGICLFEQRRCLHG